MFKNRLQHHIKEMLGTDEKKVELFQDEKMYAEEHHLLSDDVIVVEKETALRFTDAYVERCEKSTMALVLVEIPKFLEERIDHLRKHLREFVFVESQSFRLLGIDAVSLEFDEPSDTYKVKLGLKMQQQHESALRTYLEQVFEGKTTTFHLAFTGKGDFWNVQFTLNALSGFQEDMTLHGAYELIHQLLFTFVTSIQD